MIYAYILAIITVVGLVRKSMLDIDQAHRTYAARRVARLSVVLDNVPDKEPETVHA